MHNCKQDADQQTLQRRDAGAGESTPRDIAIVYQPVSALKLDPRNPRVHGPKQIRQIARSIEAFGFVVPILVDASGKIIAGHGRISAAQLLGWSEVPTICLDHLTEAQVKAFMIADNRLTENSTWDDRLLAQHLKDLSLLELDFSLEVTGFEMGEIDLRIEGLEVTPAGRARSRRRVAAGGGTAGEPRWRSVVAGAPPRLLRRCP